MYANIYGECGRVECRDNGQLGKQRSTQTDRQRERARERERKADRDREGRHLMGAWLVCFICSAIGFTTANQTQLSAGCIARARKMSLVWVK